MENRDRMQSQKRSLWDLLKEGSKGLGILFPSEEKKQPRKTSSVRVSAPSNPAASSVPEESFGKSGSEEALQNHIVSSDGHWTPRVMPKKEHPEESNLPSKMEQSVAVSLDEETKRNLQQIQEQLKEIRQIQVEQSQAADSTPVVVENALEKFFYWVQERENKQVDGLVKEMEQRLNSGQLEILMELRTLVTETDKMALAEQKIAMLEKLSEKRLTRLRIATGLLIFIIGSLSGFAIWFWFAEILRLTTSVGILK